MAIAILILLILLLALAGALYEARAEAAGRRRFPPPGRLVPAGAGRVHLAGLGEAVPGRPAVLLESGQGSWSLVWRELQGQIADFARVLAYDRAGLGWSDPGERPRTPERLAAELHRALAAAGETGPFVLVGHAMGCQLARLYAARYPEQAAALVMVDPAPGNPRDLLAEEARSLRKLASRSQVAAALARLGIPRLARRRFFPSPASSPDQTLLASQTLNPHFFQALADETRAFLDPSAWRELPDSLGDLFLVIVSPGKDAGQAEEPDPLLGLSSRSHRIPVAGGTNTLAAHPEAVLAAIQAAVEIASLRPASRSGSAGDGPASQPAAEA